MTCTDLSTTARALRVLVTGPRDTPAQRAAIEDEAALYRSEGYAVTTPWDVLAASGASKWESMAFARAKTDVLLDRTDVLVLMPGWDEDSHALATQAIAEDLGIPIVQ